MPLTLQARPGCCSSSSLSRKRAPVRAPACCGAASQLTSSRRLLTNFSLSARFATTRGSVLGSAGSKLTKVITHDEVREEEDDDPEELVVAPVESVQQHVECRRKREISKAALMAGLLGLQICLPAFAENMGLAEVAPITDLSDFQSGFSSSFLLIFFSEIGDKTFFIAALLATRKSNLAVFSGTFGALAAMTVISVTLGRAFHYLDDLIPNFGSSQLPLDDLAAVVLLVYFGVSTLVDAASMEGSKAEEEKQDAELAIAGISGNGNFGFQAAASTVAATFALVFVAEWGDKSFFSTIALAAASSPAGVVTGAIAGHGVATVLAVVGGSFLSEYVSEKLIAYVGGTLFLVFAATTLVDILK